MERTSLSNVPSEDPSPVTALLQSAAVVVLVGILSGEVLLGVVLGGEWL